MHEILAAKTTSTAVPVGVHGSYDKIKVVLFKKDF
jgi:hypothetical protein